MRVAGRSGANRVLNRPFNMAKQSMLLGGNSENHSNASPVKENENTLHQIGSLTTWNIIWLENVRIWLSGLVVPSYLSKVCIFHRLGRGVSRMNDVKGKLPSAWTIIQDGCPPWLAPKLSATVGIGVPLEANVFSSPDGWDRSTPIVWGWLSWCSSSTLGWAWFSRAGLNGWGRGDRVPPPPFAKRWRFPLVGCAVGLYSFFTFHPSSVATFSTSPLYLLGHQSFLLFLLRCSSCFLWSP